MDPIRNPYSPGAGTPPPELAGRDAVRKDIRIALERVRIGNPAKSAMLIGLRGVGKTVLLEQIRQDAESSGIKTLRVEAPEDRSLPAVLAPALRTTLLKLSTVDNAKDLATRALRALAGFASKLKVTYKDIQVGIDYDPEPGLADNGDLLTDLEQLLEASGEAAKRGDTAIAMFIDELQYVPEQELAALITALHRVSQRRLPVVLVAAGLPQLPGQMGKAKSYAERLFEFTVIGPLSREDAIRAVRIPAQSQGVDFDDDAIDYLVEKTQGYPYFLQEWGKHSWDVAVKAPISRDDVERASGLAIAALDESFFRVRFDRLTPSEQRYLRAMAELGAGPHRSGDIAQVLGRAVQSIAPLRYQLIRKGMIWSPKHGDTAFTVPLFDGFMKRRMPSDGWRTV